jgi:Mrp family chromosome partitioning ATPase/capsular polysaccharide biosynthesis protein
MDKDAPHAAHESTDLREQLRPIWRWKWFILGLVTLVTGAAYWYDAGRPDRYRATTTVFVKTSQLESSLFGVLAPQGDERNTVNQATLVTTPAVARQAARRIGYRSDPRNLLKRVAATPEEDRDFLKVSAVGGTALAAAHLANAFAEAFIDVRGVQAREQTREALRATRRELAQIPRGPGTGQARAELEAQARRLQVAEKLSPESAEQVVRAVPPRARSAPRPLRAAIFAVVFSLLLSIAAAFGLERLDRRIKTLEDVGRLYPHPLLGVVPRTKDASPLHDGAPVIPEPLREPFRTLRVGIELAGLDHDVRTLAVISAVPEEGKSTVIRNLALVYAEAGYRVAVVESDLRKPVLASTFNVQPRPGLTEVLAGTAQLEAALKRIDSPDTPGSAPGATATLEAAAARVAAADPLASGNGSRTQGYASIMSSGPEPPNPPVLLEAPRFRAVVDALRRTHDLVLFDTPPLLAVSDAIKLVELADATLIVTRLNATTRDAARRLGEILHLVPTANLIGVVANDVAPGDLASTGRYAYGGYGA